MVITLPKKALKYLDDKIVQVEVDDNLIKKEIDIKAVENAKGILKNIIPMVLHIKKKFVKNGRERLKSNNFLFDTNIFIYHLNAESAVEEYFSDEFIQRNNIYFSVITEIELLSFPKLNSEEN